MSLSRPAAASTDARDAILDAATRVFAELGFHGTTMRAIAERAGVSQALLHHHFGSKKALWRTAGERLSDHFVAYVAPALGPDVPVERAVPQAMRAYLRYWREHPAAFRFNLWRLLEGPADERAQRSRLLNARGVPVLQRAQAAGHVRRDMPAGLAMVIAGALIQFWLHSRIEIRDALAVTGDVLPDDDAFLGTVLGLIAPPRRATAKPIKRQRRKR